MKSQLMYQLRLFPETLPNEFRRQGKLWRLVYAGEPIHQPPCKGLAYLAHLLAAPHRPISALMLEQAVEGRDPIVPGSAGEHLSDETQRKYSQRIEELQSELEEAKKHQDLGHQERLIAEWDLLKAELKRVAGLGKRSRHACDDLDRARRRVKMCISRAMDQLENDHLSLWIHLDRAVRTGRVLSYVPEHPIEWLL